MPVATQPKKRKKKKIGPKLNTLSLSLSIVAWPSSSSSSSSPLCPQVGLTAARFISEQGKEGKRGKQSGKKEGRKERRSHRSIFPSVCLPQERGKEEWNGMEWNGRGVGSNYGSFVWGRKEGKTALLLLFPLLLLFLFFFLFFLSFFLLLSLLFPSSSLTFSFFFFQNVSSFFLSHHDQVWSRHWNEQRERERLVGGWLEPHKRGLRSLLPHKKAIQQNL